MQAWCAEENSLKNIKTLKKLLTGSVDSSLWLHLVVLDKNKNNIVSLI